MENSITIITPTIGRPSLKRLIASIDRQTLGIQTIHILLWDAKRSNDDIKPEDYNSKNRYSIVINDAFGKNANAPGSPLRAVGLMASNTEWVTFADDDVWYEENHFELLLKAAKGLNWSSTLRRIWSPEGKLFGVDRFESVGDELTRRVPYEMCDNSTMMFKRVFGSHAAVLYRETTEYNDDRLMYQFLKKNAGPRGKTNQATVNHICPDHLIDFFRENCSST